MTPARIAARLLAAGLLVSGPAPAQDKYPSKVVRIVTATPGGNHDWGARLAAQELTPRIGQRVIVENRGTIAIEVAKDAPPDGYTLLFYGATVWLQPLLTKSNWDPVTDFAPITLAMSSPNVLVVHPSLPVKSVKDLIALARARPGDLNYSAGGGGSTPHIAGELFKYMANARIVRVHYKGSGPAMLGLLVGEVQMMFAAVGPIAPHVKQGKVRALAVTTPKATPFMPALLGRGDHRLLRAAQDAAGPGRAPEPRDRAGAQGGRSEGADQRGGRDRRRRPRRLRGVHPGRDGPDGQGHQERFLHQLRLACRTTPGATRVPRRRRGRSRVRGSISRSISPTSRRRDCWCASSGRSTRTPSCNRWCAGSSSAASRRTGAARSCSPTSWTRKAGATTCRWRWERSRPRRASTRPAWARRSRKSARRGSRPSPTRSSRSPSARPRASRS